MSEVPAIERQMAQYVEVHARMRPHLLALQAEFPGVTDVMVCVAIPMSPELAVKMRHRLAVCSTDRVEMAKQCLAWAQMVLAEDATLTEEGRTG